MKLLRLFLSPLVLQKMKEDYFSQLDDYDEPFCEQIQHGSRLFVGSNSNPFDQFNPTEPPQILDIRDLKEAEK